mmetsp:Transcript_40576/g.122544  ORF Transcript_40576/g.122544 Transcript_40576/m.122544 type:complete len:220 (-) Transcript_40576:1236-1895(-)
MEIAATVAFEPLVLRLADAKRILRRGRRVEVHLHLVVAVPPLRAPRPPRDAIVQIGRVPHGHGPIPAEQVVVNQVHKRFVARATSFEHPGQLHLEATLLQEIGGQGHHGAAHGMPNEEHLPRALLCVARLAPARAQGADHHFFQAARPSLVNALVHLAAWARGVVQINQRALLVHPGVGRIRRPAEGDDARLGRHKVRRRRKLRGLPADQGRVKEERLR